MAKCWPGVEGPAVVAHKRAGALGRQEVGTNLGKGIAVLIQLFNPEIIILGGELVEAKQFMLPAIEQAINTYCMAQLREKTSLVVSKLVRNAVMLGSVAPVMENIFESYLELA